MGRYAAGGRLFYAGVINNGVWQTPIPGWVVSKTATGVYRVTHNLGLTVSIDMPVVATALVSGGGSCVLTMVNINWFEVSRYNSAGVLADGVVFVMASPT